MAEEEYLAKHICIFQSAKELNREILGRATEQKKSGGVIMPRVLAKPSTIPAREIPMPEDKNFILFIKNDSSILNVITNYRKKATEMFIFVESTQYISVIAKNHESFPLIYIRIPIQGNIMIGNQLDHDKFYDLPVESMTSKITKSLKTIRDLKYSICYQKTAQSISFQFDIYGDDENIPPNSAKINTIQEHTPVYIESLICDTSIALVSRQAAPIQKLLDMSILMLTEVDDGGIDLLRIRKEDSCIIVDNGILSILNDDGSEESSVPLASKEHSHVWLFSDTSQRKYSLKSTSLLLKPNLTKKTKSSKIYYLFTIYEDFYMFIKLISPLEVDVKGKDFVFSKVFSSCPQILECFGCSLVSEK